MKKSTFILLFTLLFFSSFVLGDELSELKAEAEAGNVEAQHYIGKIYLEGEGVIQDYRKAFYWYQKAAGQDNALAQSSLGVMYLIGEGVIKDYVQAHKWFNIASASGDENSRDARDMAEKGMTNDQIAEAQRLSKEWMEAHKQ